jgi:membrane-associated phospholipid phosphatase
MPTQKHARGFEDANRFLRAVFGDLREVDHAVYSAVAGTPTPSLDVPLRTLSTVANYSRIWFGIAGLLALFGGRTGRRAAFAGAVSIGVTAAVNVGLKTVGRRRPDREEYGVPEERRVRMPTSTSFPSGHSAAGFAFANSVSAEIPGLAFPLRVLALCVAYSRVHTGVHYPSDALAGGIVGGVVGQTVAFVTHRGSSGCGPDGARPPEAGRPPDGT